MKVCAFALGILLLAVCPAGAERINQEGRILGTMPVVTNAILFNTTNADAVVSALQVFPVTNPWNEDISRRPVLANSDAMIAQINADVGASHRKLSIFPEMNFVFVPDNQALQSFEFLDYSDQSDLNGGTDPFGLYPAPANLPIEGWPAETGDQTITEWQTNDDGSDRHAIIVAPGTGKVWETWRTILNAGQWQAANGAMFNLNTNGLRPDSWTSGDAAGFPMFPALVRYDECQRGMVEHACRLVVVHSRAQHIYPATHNTSGYTGTNYPAMGQRLRLKADFVIPATWTKEEKALVLGLKKYGGMVSDNSSSFFSLSITPDDRWGSAFDHLISPGIAITNFEVIQTTGPNEGPRSPGAPVAYAGPDQQVALGQPMSLAGYVAYSNVPPTVQWKLYSGPGTVQFGDPAQTNTTASFSAPGAYTLELSAADGVHAVAYDAVVLTVINGIQLSIVPAGTNVTVSWVGGNPPYVLQQTDTLPASAWTDIATTSVQNVSLPVTVAPAFFRVQGQ